MINFIVGLMLGGSLGALMMVIVQINKEEGRKWDNTRE